jgi:epoxyqueuosine reductase
VTEQSLNMNITQPISQPVDDEGVRIHFPISETEASSLTPTELAARVRDAALELGITRIAFSPVERLDQSAKHLKDWLDAGRHGDMDYLLGAADRADPRALLGSARTLVAVAIAYDGQPLVPLRSSEQGPVMIAGSIARYARGNDYHDVLRGKLRNLANACANIVGRPILARHCVDTAPLLERAAAVHAGLGFASKSTMTIIPGLGSYVMLGELLIDLELTPGEPMAPRCGACRACLDACPTGAFVDAHVLDARRCISYLTIEHRGPIPRELRAAFGVRVFGCDVCQEVCPFNASSAPKPKAPELAARPELVAVDLVKLLEIGSAQYRKFVKGSAMRRTHRAQLSRNAAIALGNSRDARAVAPLQRAVAAHPIALVRGHAAWALGELGSLNGEHSVSVLRSASETDADAWVREEAGLALERLLKLAADTSASNV